MSYTPNNIRFRIVSSGAIAQFKSDQAFDFNELINNDSYKFSAAARETLLLNYEVWFKFILRLEKILIRSLKSSEKLGELVLILKEAAKDILNEVKDVVHTHPAIFTSDDHSMTLIGRAHNPFVENVFAEILSCSTESMYTAFPNICAAISNSLHNLLFILHEVENLKHQEDYGFLSMTEEVVDIWAKTGTCLLADRAVFYKDIFGVDTFYLKNYSGKPISPLCYDIMEEVGIIIKGVNELTNFEHMHLPIPKVVVTQDTPEL
jgi:hypothetical protein